MRQVSNFRLFGEWSVLFLVSALLVVVSLQNQWTQRIDAIVLDLATEWRAGPADERIILVEIDDRSLSEFGNWPWDRSRHALLVESLTASGPQAIVFDILFLEPIESTSDQALASAIAQAGNTVLPHTFATQTGTVDEIVPVLPIDTFAAASAGLGHVAVAPDPDGIVRRFSPVIETEDGIWPHLVATTATLADGPPVLTDGTIEAPISTMRPAGAFRSLSAADVIAGRIPAEFIAGKIVLVGATGQGLGDRYSVPEYAGRVMPGVEIQANFLSASLNDELLRPARLQYVGVGLILAIALVFVGLWKLAPAWALRVCVTIAIALLAFSIIAAAFGGVWVPVAPAVLSILIAYPLWGWRRLSSVSRFLEDEATKMAGVHEIVEKSEGSGFDTVARQVIQVKSLIGETSERLVFFRQLISASPDPILVFDGDGALSLMNPRGEDIFGDLSSSQGLSMTEIVAEQRAVLDHEKDELTLNDGRVFLVARSDVGLGKNNRILALRDISAMRETEAQRAEMLEFLSHDMRSPQVAIIGLAGGNGGAHDSAERLGRIEKQARRTLKLTEDFVQIARLDYEGVSREETDISALLHEALDRAYPHAKRKHVKLEATVPEEPEFCFVDPFALSRAIDNLLGNAIKFSANGKAVQLCLARDDERSITIRVTDQGPGLPAERRSNTFARFGAHDSQAGPSAGLGLAFVKKVVDQHDGNIEVASEEGVGSSFTIVLPCLRGGAC